MIETVIIFKQIHLIFCLFIIGLLIILYYKIEVFFENYNILVERLNLKENQLFFNEFGHTFLIMRQISGKPMRARGITPFKL